MLIAFYAPMKSPFSPRPSGDRKIARLFIAALKAAGFEVAVPTSFRSWEGQGDLKSQMVIRDEGHLIADKLISQYLRQPVEVRPKAWFCYHLYHKAPDWIGPTVCKALDIPYLVAEASIAPKQSSGRWRLGYEASKQAIENAAQVFSINPADLPILNLHLNGDKNVTNLAPFLDLASNVDPISGSQRELRGVLARQYKLDADKYWLLTVAMMREDSKLDSYRALARAMEHVKRKDWQLIIVGDGQAQTLVREFFRFDLERSIHFLGKKDEQRIYQLMQASDLFVWPAINEALGMVALESLANGLPVICGRAGGISQIVEQGTTGWLIDNPDDPEFAREFAGKVEQMLDQPSVLAKFSAASLKKYHRQHSLEQAARALKQVVSVVTAAQ